MNMIDCINAIEQESNEFRRLLSAIDGVESVSYHVSLMRVKE